MNIYVYIYKYMLEYANYYPFFPIPESTVFCPPVMLN